MKRSCSITTRSPVGYLCPFLGCKLLLSTCHVWPQDLNFRDKRWFLTMLNADPGRINAFDDDLKTFFPVLLCPQLSRFIVCVESPDGARQS
eukprot:COSAG02_NODE_14_length_56855_cov_512.793661_40_plen_91_part_00